MSLFSRFFGVSLAMVFAATATAQLRVQEFASGLDAPVLFMPDPTDANRSFVVQQGGKIVQMVGGSAQATPFIDVSGSISKNGERGLLGMAFDPQYASNGHAYLYTTDLSGAVRVVRYTRSTSTGLLDPSTERTIIRVPKTLSNHNGGTLRFGPDGMLYLGLGDGGGSFDPGQNAQDPNSLLGKMLRIDVRSDDFLTDDDANYSIPSDNPFAGSDTLGARDEIWAFGVRNPWKWSFDSLTGAMIMADVGQGEREEINVEPSGEGGRNYGWVPFEGTLQTGQGTLAFADTKPVFEYDHSLGASVTGGYLYRGSDLGAAYQNRYFFGDFISGRLFSVAMSFDAVTGEATASGFADHSLELGLLGNISSIDLTATGELVVVDYNGRLLQLQPVPEPATLLGLGAGLAMLARRRTKKVQSK